MMRSLFVIILSLCFFTNEASLFGVKIKGGVQRLMDTVVDVIVADKNEESSEGKSSNGTGFIIYDDGYVVTNWHVIEGSEKIKVVTSDGNEYIARVMGKEEHYDVALLKIDLDQNVKLSSVKFADSDKIEVCDPVIAIGNPFGLGKTVTAGIVSYKGRNLSDQISELGVNGNLVSYIQTDAAVNYGNSGGPLFSANGEVVGMITVFVLDGLHSTGINFAIPSNILQKVINQLKTFGKMQRSWLGISTCRMSKEASKLLIGSNVGYYVTNVSDKSPAMSTGIKVGDIVLSVNGEVISGNTNMEYLLNNLPIGEVIPIQIMRDGNKRMLSITVKSYNDEDISFVDDDDSSGKDIPFEKISGLDLGLTNLTRELREIFKIPSHENGVLVSFVGSSLSDDIGVGNLIKKVNQFEIRNLNDMKSSIAAVFKENKGGDKIVLYVQDPLIKKSSYVVVKCNIVRRKGK
ncbi:MAG: trypsin-like peptidase domain-containing protein [Alphaproteobacteria bacterium]|nr:trypsin-like peptidase domain-containing protein [Alphaproteobacteria bacterium]